MNIQEIHEKVEIPIKQKAVLVYDDGEHRQKGALFVDSDNNQYVIFQRYDKLGYVKASSLYIEEAFTYTSDEFNSEPENIKLLGIGEVSCDVFVAGVREMAERRFEDWDKVRF